ncbi:MAG TPA: hypothetical protein PLS53_14075 [Thermoanaerobaculaceae bacterium]|nr:hypothetical protein [Thermoanaerobaculaceae bacterium]HPS79282.1 hypothetical protein [Thermoanaerobaculaceae bacterium]
MRGRIRTVAVCVVALGLRPGFAAVQAVTFDFDTATPVLATGQSLPLDQSTGGVSAQFSGPFSVQTDGTAGIHLSAFSGKYLYPRTLAIDKLTIGFGRRLTGITLTFATADFQQAEVPTTIQLTAYLGSTGTPAVGSATAHGTYGTDTMPEGTLAFDSAGQPFDFVEIVIPPGPLVASNFLVDNVIVTPVLRPALPIRRHLARAPSAVRPTLQP